MTVADGNNILRPGRHYFAVSYPGRIDEEIEQIGKFVLSGPVKYVVGCSDFITSYNFAIAGPCFQAVNVVKDIFSHITVPHLQGVFGNFQGIGHFGRCQKFRCLHIDIFDSPG
jgi:hypothetical protein